MKGGADQRPGVGEGEPCHLTVAKCEGWSVSPAYKPRPTPRLEALHPRPAATQQLPLEGADWSREPPAPLGSPQPRGSLGPFWDKQRLHPDAGTALTPCLEAGPGHPNPREQPLAPQDLWPRPCEPSGPGLGSGQVRWEGLGHPPGFWQPQPQGGTRSPWAAGWGGGDLETCLGNSAWGPDPARAPSGCPSDSCPGTPPWPCPGPGRQRIGCQRTRSFSSLGGWEWRSEPRSRAGRELSWYFLLPQEP